MKGKGQRKVRNLFFVTPSQGSDTSCVSIGSQVKMQTREVFTQSECWLSGGGDHLPLHHHTWKGRAPQDSRAMVPPMRSRKQAGVATSCVLGNKEIGSEDA